MRESLANAASRERIRRPQSGSTRSRSGPKISTPRSTRARMVSTLSTSSEDETTAPNPIHLFAHVACCEHLEVPGVARELEVEDLDRVS